MNTQVDVFGLDNFRLHLSHFSCYNGNPRNWIDSRPKLTIPSRKGHIEDALERFRETGDAHSFGTCPSMGAQIIHELMDIVADPSWTIQYFIITDGRIGKNDEGKFRTAVREIKSKLRAEQQVCAVTVGRTQVRQIRRLMKTDCIFTVEGFPSMVLDHFPERVSKSLELGGISETALYSRHPELFPITQSSPPMIDEGGEDDFDDYYQSDDSVDESGPAPNDNTDFQTQALHIPLLITGTVIGTLLVLIVVATVAKKRWEESERLRMKRESIALANVVVQELPKVGRRSRADSQPAFSEIVPYAGISFPSTPSPKKSSVVLSPFSSSPKRDSRKSMHADGSPLRKGQRVLRFGDDE